MTLFLFGMVMALGAVGGMEHQPGYLVEQILAAVIGLVFMYVGTEQIKNENH